MALHQPAQSYPWTFRRAMGATLVLVSVALCFWLLYRFNQVVLILFTAILIGTVIRPAVTWLYRRGLPRVAGIFLVYFLLLALLIGFVLLLFPLVVEQGTTIAAGVPGYYQSLRDWMVTNPNQWIVQLSEFLPVTLPSLEPAQQTSQQMLTSAGQALDYVALAAKVVFIAIVILLLAYHWTLDGPRIVQSILPLLPEPVPTSIG